MSAFRTAALLVSEALFRVGYESMEGHGGESISFGNQTDCRQSLE